MNKFKPGDLVATKHEKTIGTVISISTPVMYERSHIRVLFESGIREIHETLLEKV